MTDKKLDFEWKFEMDYNLNDHYQTLFINNEPIPQTTFLFNKIKEVCQAVEAINEKLGFLERALDNYREYKTGIEDLETDVMYLQKRLDKLENKGCDHRFIPFMLDSSNTFPSKYKCTKCGAIE